MLKFNNNNIFTGYLKQLLKEFNLPKYRVYTIENKKYHNWAVEQRQKLKLANRPASEFPPLEKDILETVEPKNEILPDNIRYALYIKNGYIQKYINEQWVTTDKQYFSNKNELNYTKHLNITNNIYDSYTHEYLGDFLRFVRDFYNVNLMPLYNCFSNTICQNLKLNLTVNGSQYIFDTSNSNYKIYMLPVKLFKNYTIAIDSNTPIELCCGFYDSYLDDREKVKYFSDFTFMRVNSSKFNTPFIYNKLTSDYLDLPAIDFMELAQNEPDLKLFIKVPANNKSSITILEGNYLGYNNILYYPVENQLKWKYCANRYITNYAVSNKDKNGIEIKLPAVSDRFFNPITKLQLLELNTGTSYPFADRLIEYLVGNTITSEDQIADNIKRVQTVMSQWDIHFPIYGAWSDEIRNIAYDYMATQAPILNNIQHDTLGYIDKDVEKYFTGKTSQFNKYPTSISNVYIYPQLYLEYQQDRFKKEDK